MFIPSSNKYRQFQFSEGDSDDVSPTCWDCPTCTRSMPDISASKRGDTVTCNNCGTKMEIVAEAYKITISRVCMVEQGEEPRWRLVINYDDCMRLKL